MLFEDLQLIPQILKAMKDEGYVAPTPIQEQAIPLMLSGRDLLGTAQTGTGKTAAYAVPILQMLNRERQILKGPHKIRALILAPTRELSIQIRDCFVSYGKYLNLRCAVVYGGVSQVPQTNAIKAGVDILIATPGRLLDLMNQKYIRLNNIGYFVLDEADQMLDMGFIHDVNRIIQQMPEKRQTMLFSATMPQEISKLAASILKDPARVAISPVKITLDTTEQYLYYVDKRNKTNLLLYLLKDSRLTSVLVFSRTKHGANRIAEDLIRSGVNAEAIHGNKSQAARQLALNHFKAHKTRVLVATDIAARGIDVSELSHVINYDLPEVPETYVHRIGRTGRAGQSGTAISFCDSEEKDCLRNIQRLIAKSITVISDHPFPMEEPVLNPKALHTGMRSFGYGHRTGRRSPLKIRGKR